MENDETRIKFGPGPTDHMPADWAEKMLTDLKATDPARFGRLMIKAIGAVK